VTFELEDLGARDLKGIAKPVRAWAALRASLVANHFEALHAASQCMRGYFHGRDSWHGQRIGDALAVEID